MPERRLFVAMLILLVILLAACGPMTSGTAAPTSTPVTAPVPETDSAAATAAAKARLALELGVDESAITVVSVEPTEFTDSCLGLGQANESCLQAMTPGYIVMLDVDGQSYEAHTDETGQQVRIAFDTPEADSGADTAAAAAQEYMVRELGVALGDVQVISSEKTEFTDSCLGLGRPEESCLQAMTPGWLIMLEVNGQPYEVHTDETGQQVRVAGDLTP